MDKQATSDLAKHQIELFKILAVFVAALATGNIGLVYKITADVSNILTWVFFGIGVFLLVLAVYFSLKVLLSIIDLLQKLKEE